jgi:hypothetical protein
MTVVDCRDLRLSCTLDFHENCPGKDDWNCGCECHSEIIERDFSAARFETNLGELIYETWRTVRKSGWNAHFSENLYRTIEKLYEKSGKTLTHKEGDALMEVIAWISNRSDYSVRTNKLRLNGAGINFDS